MILKNGEVWESQDGTRAMTQWLMADLWTLLGMPSEADHGGTALQPFEGLDGEGNRGSVFSHEELKRRLSKHHWKQKPGHGVIEAMRT